MPSKVPQTSKSPGLLKKFGFAGLVLAIGIGLGSFFWGGGSSNDPSRDPANKGEDYALFDDRNPDARPSGRPAFVSAKLPSVRRRIFDRFSPEDQKKAVTEYRSSFLRAFVPLDQFKREIHGTLRIDHKTFHAQFRLHIRLPTEAPISTHRKIPYTIYGVSPKDFEISAALELKDFSTHGNRIVFHLTDFALMSLFSDAESDLVDIMIPFDFKSTEGVVPVQGRNLFNSGQEPFAIGTFDYEQVGT